MKYVSIKIERHAVAIDVEMLKVGDASTGSTRLKCRLTRIQAQLLAEILREYTGAITKGEPRDPVTVLPAVEIDTSPLAPKPTKVVHVGRGAPVYLNRGPR